MTGLPSPEHLTGLALLAPFVAALLIPLFRHSPNVREAVTLVTAASLCLAVAALLPSVLGGIEPELQLLQVAPGLALAFKVEPLGLLFALVASSLWIINSIYSIGYMRANREPRQTIFYVCFALALGSTVGLALAGNLFTLFLFYEALTIVTYPLVTHNQDGEAVRAGRLYLLLLLGGSLLLLLPAIVATWMLAGTLDFTPGGILGGKADAPMMAVLLVLYVFGIGKAAVMPMHPWLPAAMVAPTPVSALLHAVAVVKAGVFTLLKVVVMIFGIEALSDAGLSLWLTAVAGITIILASLIALGQDNLKRRLAYSTISQLSYVVLGAAILTPLSVIGAALHIAAHALGKITLFFAAGSIHTAAHLTKVSELDGLGRRMPWTMSAFAIGALAMIGLPPTAGFLGKWFILGAAVQSSNWLAVGVICISTGLTASYFLPIVYRAFFRPFVPAHGDGHHHDEAPWPIVLALTATAVATLLLFLWPEIPFRLAASMMGA
ncbi:MAG TPA: proton-conducting transporter membrane subunit [Reyranella sp.]|nr:proton-conducting transporter membrane subunit [Reyranella sp.]